MLRELEIANKDNTIKNKYKSVAKKFSVGQSMVCKWKKQGKDLNAEAEKLRTQKRRSGIDGLEHHGQEDFSENTTQNNILQQKKMLCQTFEKQR